VVKTAFDGGSSGSIDGGSNLTLPFYGGGGGRLDTDGGGLISGSAIKVGVGGFNIEGWDLDRRVLW